MGETTSTAQPAPTQDEVRRLVERGQQGDRDALEELYLIHFDRIYSYLHMTVGNRHDAEDLTTQTFLRMLESIRKFRFQSAPFSAWLFRIAHNLSMDHFRANRRWQPEEEVPEPQGSEERSAEDQAFQAIGRQSMLELIDSLSQEQQQVLPDLVLESPARGMDIRRGVRFLFEAAGAQRLEAAAFHVARKVGDLVFGIGQDAADHGAAHLRVERQHALLVDVGGDGAHARMLTHAVGNFLPVGERTVDAGQLDVRRDAEDARGYAKAKDEDFYRRQRELMGRVVAESDVVITTAVVPGRRAPVLVTTDMVAAMAPGSVVIDLAAERGGNCEPTRPGETRTVPPGVTVVGAVNLAGTVPYHASQMYARTATAFLLHLLGDGGVRTDADDEIVRETLVTRGGEVVHARVREAMAAATADGKEG